MLDVPAFGCLLLGLSSLLLRRPMFAVALFVLFFPFVFDAAGASSALRFVVHGCRFGSCMRSHSGRCSCSVVGRLSRHRSGVFFPLRRFALQLATVCCRGWFRYLVLVSLEVVSGSSPCCTEFMPAVVRV